MNQQAPRHPIIYDDQRKRIVDINGIMWHNPLAGAECGMSDFETFTRDKIVRLRADADALEKILKEFLGTQARAAGASRRSGPDQPRAGAFGVVMEAINGAGYGGLTLDEMIQTAEAEGYAVKRPTLRSQIFQAKQDGDLVQIEPGRYRSASAISPQEAFGGINVPPPSPADVHYTPPAIMPDPESTATFQHSFGPDLDDEIPF